MANELNIDFFESGLTVTATLIQGNAAVGSPVALAESGTIPGHYSGNMPSVAAGVYLVRFEGGGFVGNGEIDWDGTAERRLLTSPTVAQLEARTLPSADYFDPATDAVATVTNLTNLPAMPTDWLTAAGLSAGAVAEIQAGLSTLTSANVRTEADAALAAVGVTSTVTGRIDAAITSRSTYDGSDTAGIVTLVSRLTSARAGYLDTIPNLLTAAAYTAPLTMLQTEIAVGNALIDYGAATAANVWGYSGRALDGTQAAQLGNLDAAISTRLATADYDPPLNALETEGAVTDALATYDAATGGDITALQAHGNSNWATATGFSTLTSADVWAYTGRSLDGTQAVNLAYLDAAITSRLAALAYTEPLTILETAGAVTDALTAYEVATTAGAFEATDRRALLAMAYGRQKIDYTASTFEMYGVDGVLAQQFDLLTADGNPATTPQEAVERVPV